MSLLDEMVEKPSEAGISSDKGTSDFETLRKKIFGSRNKTSKVKTERKADAETETANDVGKLFEGENWEEIASLYFDARYAITGYEEFQLNGAQKKTLGMTLGKSMQMLLKIDPGYIALTVFLTNFGGLIMQKEICYKKALKELEKQNAK